MKTALLFLLALATGLSAAEPTLTPLGRLELLDGRILKNVVVRSYDTHVSKVLLIADGKALLIPIDLIPPPHADRILAASRRTAPDLVQTTPVPPPPAPAAPPATSSSVPVPTPFQPSAPTTPPPPPPAPVPVAPAPVAAPTDPRRAHQAAALAHALRYYKYEYRTGSNAIAVTDSDIAVERTEAVPGWTNRYRTIGKAYVQAYDSYGGGSFRRSTSRFELLTEQKPGEDIQVVDFTRK